MMCHIIQRVMQSSSFGSTVAKNGMALKDLSLDDSDSNGYTEITADIMSKLLAQKVFW